MLTSIKKRRTYTQNENTLLKVKNNIERSTTEPKEGSPTSGGAVHPRSESLQRVRRPNDPREGPKTHGNRKEFLDQHKHVYGGTRKGEIHKPTVEDNTET